MKSEKSKCSTDKRAFISKLCSQKIVVMGDFIVDEFIYGVSSRVSVEAPVIVTKYKSKHKEVGGAGNAVRSLTDWGGYVVPLGVVGDDENGRVILEKLTNLGVSVDNIVVAKNRATPTKTRIMAGSKRGMFRQVFRLDREDDEPYPQDIQKKLADNFKYILEFVQPDLILVSDYSLKTLSGALTWEIASGGTKIKNRVFVDSHDVCSFKNVAGAVVNIEELSGAINKKEPNDIWETKGYGKELIKKIGAGCVLLTLGKNGMMLFVGEDEPVIIPADQEIELKSVLSVGDLVFTTFARSFDITNDPELSARIANAAAQLLIAAPDAKKVDLHKVLEEVGMRSGEFA